MSEENKPIKYRNESRKRYEWRLNDENGIFHRTDGPALMYDDGSYEYRFNGMIHRDNGPAMYWVAGNKKYFSDRIMFDNNDRPVFVDKNSDKYILFQRPGSAWFKYGEYHRIGGPAIEYTDGEEHWCVNGQYHREDGPAVINPKGSVKYMWYQNDKLHRTNGPAVEKTNGANEWWENGERYG